MEEVGPGFMHRWPRDKAARDYGHAHTECCRVSPPRGHKQACLVTSNSFHGPAIAHF